MSTELKVSVCICTRNRPEDLRRALQSTRASNHPIYQVIVSDDSTDVKSKELTKVEFPEVLWIEGPKRGLGANRNSALAKVTGTHVLFVDDDVQIAPEFLTKINEHVEQHRSIDTKIIVTGKQFDHDRPIVPQRPDFLGFQSIAYSTGEELSTIVINASVFPSQIFRSIKFDENLVYGCDELDIAAQAIHLAGCSIHFLDAAANYHFPSQVNRDYYAPFEDASRIFVMYKRYSILQRKPLKGRMFLLIAYFHNLLANLKRKPKGGLVSFWSTVKTSRKYIKSTNMG